MPALPQPRRMPAVYPSRLANTLYLPVKRCTRLSQCVYSRCSLSTAISSRYSTKFLLMPLSFRYLRPPNAPYAPLPSAAAENAATEMRCISHTRVALLGALRAAPLCAVLCLAGCAEVARGDVRRAGAVSCAPVEALQHALVQVAVDGARIVQAPNGDGNVFLQRYVGDVEAVVVGVRHASKRQRARLVGARHLDFEVERDGRRLLVVLLILVPNGTVVVVFVVSLPQVLPPTASLQLGLHGGRRYGEVAVAAAGKRGIMINKRWVTTAHVGQSIGGRTSTSTITVISSSSPKVRVSTCERAGLETGTEECKLTHSGDKQIHIWARKSAADNF